jgi:dihydropteroate synthase
MVLGDELPPVIMGVLNLSPESFYKGSVVAADTIVGRAQEMIREGATVLDVGARSTAPGVVPITVEEELRRVEAVLPQVLAIIPATACLSVDTQYTAVAARAAQMAHDAGVPLILNAISLSVDPTHQAYIVESQLPLV